MTENKLPPFSILVATPDDRLSADLGIALKQTGFRVVFTTTGTEAVQFSREEDVSMMILDTSLPGINGYEATQLIRQSGGEDIVIILLAWFCVQSLEMANSLGCNELVAKPVNAAELVEIVHKWEEVLRIKC